VALGFPDAPCVRQLGEAFQLADRAEFQLIMLDLVFPAKPFAL
jgi:hypothetical protein